LKIAKPVTVDGVPETTAESEEHQINKAEEQKQPQNENSE